MLRPSLRLSAPLALSLVPLLGPACAGGTGGVRGGLALHPERRQGVPAPDLESLLREMTLAEKLGQMAQADRSAIEDGEDVTTLMLGSVLSGGNSLVEPNEPAAWADTVDRYQEKALATRLGIPLVYGIDAVHGHNAVRGAVIFPHNIGLGATRDPALVERAAQVTAEEVAATGIGWTFAPCIAVPQDERWGRTYEGFGETAELATLLAPAAVRGFQTATTASVMACAKHFLGDGGTQRGQNEGNTEIDEATLRALHLPGYVAAVKAGVASVMASYSSWNGTKMHAQKYLLTDVLKGELGFQGFVVSDWEGVDRLPGPDYKSKLAAAINAGVDMVMVPVQTRFFLADMTALVNERVVPMARIDDAVRRILGQKKRFGLWEHPFARRELLAAFGGEAHRAVARQAVRESLVLLKNEAAPSSPVAAGTPAARPVLPFKAGTHLVVVGDKADDLGVQCGGWAVGWQGSRGPITRGTTLFAGLREVGARHGARVELSPGAEGPALSSADVIVAVVGELPYAETQGDRGDLNLTAADRELVTRAKASGKPVVVLIVSGRPMILGDTLTEASAVAALWLPGTEGEGVADVLFGDAAPTGKLPHSWPHTMSQIPINVGDPRYAPLFPYGFGLTY